MPVLAKENISVFDDLSERYREILFSSIITSCGLDGILFSNDEKNGHVDTIHNVVESTKDSKNKDPLFKSKRHQDEYGKRGKYNSETYHSADAYIDKGKEWNKQRDEGNLKDTYTGRTINPGEKYDRDHVISAKKIHEDPRRALSSLNGEKLANQDSNLQPTHPSINRSKGADSTEVFLKKQKDKLKENSDEVARLKISIADGSASEGAQKRLESLEARLSIDENRIKKAAYDAEKAMSHQHNIAYYTSKDFISTTSSYALKAGFKMGARQGLGIILLELSVALQEEFPQILKSWQAAPTWKEKLDIKSILEHVTTVLRNTWHRLKEKLGHIISEVKNGFSAGILSEVVTTIINIFTGTAKRIMKMLRTFWGAIISSLHILIFNPTNLNLDEKLAAVMRLLSIAVGTMIQPIIAEAIDTLLLNSPIPLPNFLREVLAEISGAALGGIISVTLVYVIDNSPIVQKIIQIMGKVSVFTDDIYQQIASVIGDTWQGLKNSVETIIETADSPAINLAAFVTCPPLGMALYFNRRLNRIENTLGLIGQGQARIENKIDNLNTSMQMSFSSVERLIRENTALLHCVIEGQKRQMAMLNQIRDEIRSGFIKMDKTIHLSVQEGAELNAIRQLKENQNELLAHYQDCTAILKRGGKPLQRDLKRIEELAISLIGKFQTRFNDQPLGSPARLPLLTGMVFALSIWRDARNVLEDDLEMCFQRGKGFADLAIAELRNLINGAKLWQLAEENSWLISQYVLLRRILAAMPSTQNTLESDNVIPMTLSSILTGWNDGLQNARYLIEQAKTEQPLSSLPIKTFDDRHSWQKLVGLPRGISISEVPMEQVRLCLGIPDEINLGASALEIMRETPALIESNRLAFAQEFS